MNTKDAKNISKDPLILIIHFLLIGIVILFVGIAYGYIFSENQEKWILFQLPKIFWLSTFGLLCTSIFIRRIRINYEKDKMQGLKFNFIWAISGGIIFCILQIYGFMQFQHMGIDISSSPSVSYIYVFAFLHLLHILVGIILFLVAYVEANKNSKDPVQRLLYFSSPRRKIKLKLLAQYWYTIDFIWFGIFLLLLYMHA